MAIEKKENQIKKYNLTSPAQVVIVAKLVKNYIVENKLFAEIAGKNYVMVEGWQFAGGLLGFYPRVVEVKELSDNRWLAQVDIIRKKDDSVMSSGFALCSKAEVKKRSFDEYAILSMAQTRAIGKAYRNLLGWIMKLAGYEATPAEEMRVNGNVSSDKFEKAKTMISQSKNTNGLLDYVEKLKASKSFSKEQKATLNKLISKRVDEISK